MYRFPGTYFHPWLQPRHCATREDLLDLLEADKQWRDHAYTESEQYQLRVELAQQQEKERAVMHAKLVAEARYRAALRELTELFREGTQVIARYPQAIVISSDNSMASIYIVTGDGNFQFAYAVPATDVLPDGSIRLPDPMTPVQGGGPAVFSPPTAVLNLTDREYHALRPSPQKSRVRSRRYANRDPFLEDLGYVLDGWRFYRPAKDPTIEELGRTPLPDGVISAGVTLELPALWPLGMSYAALKTLLGKKKGHGIDLKTFMQERPRPRRT